MIGFAVLRVNAVQKMGAFLDWGQPQDLFLPLREQVGEVYPEEELVVFITSDQKGLPIASMRLEAFLSHDPSVLRVDQRVELLVIDESDLGFTAIINGRHLGMLYHGEVFEKIGYGSRLPGYVKKVREDGKVDLILQPTGIKGRADLGQQILARLRAAGGFLPLSEKSPPEEIYAEFAVSKKKYKEALGGLYKRKLVELETDGVRLR